MSTSKGRDETDSSASTSSISVPRKKTASQRVWRFLCDLIPDAENPKWNPDAPTVEKTEASLTTESQRQRRAQLVTALQTAVALEDSLPASSSSDAKDEQDPRLTVHLHGLHEESLIAPELFYYTVSRGFVQLIQAGDKVTTIFSQGVGTQAYAKRRAIAEGMDVQTRNMLRTVVRICSEDEYRTAVQRARQRGYRFTVVTSLAIVVLLGSLLQPALAAAV